VEEGEGVEDGEEVEEAEDVEEVEEGADAAAPCGLRRAFVEEGGTGSTMRWVFDAGLGAAGKRGGGVNPLGSGTRCASTCWAGVDGC